jgi:signal transduction histidine kinase/ActR/RegA family two-component response regulator
MTMTDCSGNKFFHRRTRLFTAAALAGLFGCYVLNFNNDHFSRAVAAPLTLLMATVFFLLFWETRRFGEKAITNQALSMRRLLGINRLHEILILPVPLDEKLKRITQTAVQLLDLDFCRIWMVKPGDLCDSGCIHAVEDDESHVCPRRDKCLHLLSSSGRYTHINGNHRRVPLGCYKIGQIATGKLKKFLTNNVTVDPRVHNHEWAKSLGLASFAGYKLRNVHDETTGVLAMFSKNPLSEDDDAFIENLAEMTSKVIIEHLAEEELQQVQKLEELGQLTGGIAHEFNNLLQVIGGYTTCALEGLSPEEERYTDLKQVLEATDRAAVLTGQLLGFSRRQTIQPKNLDANSLVCDLKKLIGHAIGEQIVVEMNLHPDAGVVYADAGELQQALLNLCLNARDAMPSGGVLKLKTECLCLEEPLALDAHFTLTPGRYVVFTVSDTGRGIPEHIQRRIFEPFFTTKDVGKGTGLGLAMVYGMVRQHRGAIHFFSEAGKGTKFKLYLPAGKGSVESHAGHVGDAETPAAPSRHETVLIAEDDPVVRNLMMRTLKSAGYKVLGASDGEEAMDIYAYHGRAISLVVLDVIMPKFTGHEVYRYIKTIDPEVKALFCTGYDRDSAQWDILERENVRLIRKPFTPQKFLEALREVMDATNAELMVG